jgi:hypothetical protein
MDFATAEGLYQITIRMSDRSATVRAVKHFLARSGVIVDNIRLSELAAPEKLNQLHDQHVQQENVARRHMMQALDAAVWFIVQGRQYQEAADTVLLALYNRRSNDIAAELGLTSAYRIQLHQPIVALSYQAIAQEMAALELGERAEMNWDEAREIIYNTTKLISEQVQTTSRVFKIDIATGRRLLANQH